MEGKGCSGLPGFERQGQRGALPCWAIEIQVESLFLDFRTYFHFLNQQSKKEKSQLCQK